MTIKIKAEDTVKLTESAIQTCQCYFGTDAQWQPKDINKRYTVIKVIEDKANKVLMLDVQEDGQSEVKQIAACHMEFVSRSVSIKELIKYVVELGAEGGGAIDVTGTWKNNPRTIRIEQIKWSETDVCLVGGYGNDISSLNPNIVSSVLDCVIGSYLDSDIFQIIECSAIELDYELLFRIGCWNYNRRQEESLTLELFEQNFGKVMGEHYYSKWVNEYKQNLINMVGYLRSDPREAQTFCNMVMQKVNEYERRKSTDNH